MTAQTTTGASGTTELGLEPNVAGALAYAFGIISGGLLYVLEDNDYVRFHAAQSLLFSGALIVLYIGVSILSTIIAVLDIPFVGLLLGLLYPVIGLVGFLGWLFLMYKAYSGERFHLPVLGGTAESMA